MSDGSPKKVKSLHFFLDEAGDPVFFLKGGLNAIGRGGVSHSFSLGMVKFAGDLNALRRAVEELQKSVETDVYVNQIPSVAKKMKAGGFYFHASEDPPEVRERFFRFLRETGVEAEIVVARKIPDVFVGKHNGKDSEFYADLLSHLLKTKLRFGQKVVLHIAARGHTTRATTFNLGLKKAMERSSKKWGPSTLTSHVVFDVQTPRTEALLNVADYICWSVQRVFEKGEVRYYDFLKDRILRVVDLYDFSRYNGQKNFYGPNNPLTQENKLGPPSP